MALADPTRRAIIDRLRGGALPVCDLACGMAVSRPAVSQHLRILKDAGLVTDRAEGTKRIYAVDATGLTRLRFDLDLFWTGALAAFKAAAEAPDDNDEEKP